MQNLRGNIFGGLTAAVVALPLALAFGVASGAGPIAGVYGAIILGLIASAFGGTPTQVSGPTGPMTVVVAGILVLFAKSHPEQGIALAFTTVLLGGIFQAALGYFKIGRFINLIPYTVVSGFMTGIGIIIILLQVAPFVGADTSPSSPVAVLRQLTQIFSESRMPAIELASICLAMLFFWPSRFDRFVPATLVVLVVGTILSITIFKDANFSTIGELPQGLPQFIIPVFDFAAIKDMIKFAFVLALLGSIDSLLTSLVADSMTNTEHDPNKELIAQGIGNSIAGLFGGLPGAGATMRTVVNIKSGGKNRLSGVIHSLAIVLFLTLGANIVSQIPNIVLAAILIKVGIDIIDWDFLFRLRKAPIRPISIVVVVTLLTVFVDLITAVFVGIVIASFYTLNRLTQDQLQKIVPEYGTQIRSLDAEEQGILDALGERILLYHMHGAFSFGAAKGIAQKLNSKHDYDVLILDLSDVSSIDASTSLALESMVKSARRNNRYVLLVIDSEQVMEMISRMGVMDVIRQQKVFTSRKQALGKAELLLLDKEQTVFEKTDP